MIAFEGHLPQLAPDVFVAEGARVIGRATIGKESSVWFNTVIRADVCPITIGEQTNIQDLAMIHVTTDVAPTTIGDRVTIGHAAIIHGCTIEDECLIGMGATILDGAVIGEGSLIGANALITPGTIVEPGSVMLGAPAKRVRSVTESERQAFVDSATHYAALAARYRNT